LSRETFRRAAREIETVLPDRADDLARLLRLLENDIPTVTVVGKYNHGKSRLLNELVGSEVFAVADKRQTVHLSECRQSDIRWLDAPGLDADVEAGDDQLTGQAVWLESDIRLFIHAAKEGELDAAERVLLDQMIRDAARSQRQTLFVLAQVDQLSDEATAQAVAKAIRAQVPGIELLQVSSTRHRKGVEEGKKLLLEKSGIPALRVELEKAVARVPATRSHETTVLVSEIGAELNRRRTEQQSLLDNLCEKQRRQRSQFDAGLVAVITKVSQDIVSMLSQHSGDDARVPDGVKDIYAITAGKLERNRLQVGYSRACIEIDSFLIGQGVIALPLEQQTASTSLNSVMIAVMGISVKHHKDLRRIFADAAGRERMQREFSHYFELSEDRRKLCNQIEQAGLARTATLKSLQALSIFGASECV
jgi:GTP-binding protein EngB required for normal cell division